MCLWESLFILSLGGKTFLAWIGNKTGAFIVQLTSFFLHFLLVRPHGDPAAEHSGT
jgi:hypothetical protein